MNIKYSQDLLNDFDKLLKEFKTFMIFNLLHANQNLSGKAKAYVSKLISFSLENSKKLQDFFQYPLLGNNEVKNKEKLEKNISNLIGFFHEYLKFAEPIIYKYRKDIHDDRFTRVKNQYIGFRKKYGI